MAYTWDQLRRRSLARQFPRVRGRGVRAVEEVVRRVGPIQSQTARSTFLGLAARLPGVTHATVTEAFERQLLVRGSSIRGTVHTSVAAHHPLLETGTRVGQRQTWQNLVRPERHSVEEIWAAVEDLARDTWSTPDDLRGAIRAWLYEHESEEVAARLDHQAGRHFPVAHAALVRRPLTGGWEGQGRPGYRLAEAVLGPEYAALRAAALGDPEAALAGLVRVHLASYGPASRQDVAWWSGVGLRTVDAALERLRPELTERPGPDGRTYWDLAEGVPRAVDDVGTHLLPEFDALLVGYDPKARDRFVTPADNAALWHASNGMLRPPVLHAGRIVGHWRLEGGGTRRRLDVRCFPGSPEPSDDDVSPAADHLGAAMGLEVDDMQILSA